MNMNYQWELFRQQTPYLQLLLEQRNKLNEKYKDCFTKSRECIHVLPLKSCMEKLDKILKDENICNSDEHIYVFVNEKGVLSKYALEEIENEFKAHKDTLLLYADEDYAGSLKQLYDIDEEEVCNEISALYRDSCGVEIFENNSKKVLYRGEPWFKPDFSPDTLKSFFYIGNIFAISGSVIGEYVKSCKSDISVYELVLSLSRQVLEKGNGHNCIRHLSQVLYTNFDLADKDNLPGFNLISYNNIDDKGCYSNNSFAEGQNMPLLSVIIPSKDNSRLLRRCLETFTANTKYPHYEFVIVDNGSCKEQEVCISNLLDEIRQINRDLKISYIYEKQEFNFSKMCNMGASASKGEYLLFLNDDIEVSNIEISDIKISDVHTAQNEDWLETMLLQAQNSYTGAVGVKLCYPKADENEEYKIQHAGITNMGIGPAHKLCGMSDTGNIYHGRNIANYNVLAVTAACLMVKKSYFYDVNGFDEELAVAYNDVDLCFKLHEKGLYNVVLNKVRIIHHESVTRGDDTSPEKQKRLELEKRILYKKHPNLSSTDIYYNKNLVQWKKDVKYVPEYSYEYEKMANPVMLSDSDIKKIPVEVSNKVLRRLTGYNNVMFELDAITEEMFGEEICIVVRGWSALRNCDNSTIVRTLLLKTVDKPDIKMYSIEISQQLRYDVNNLFADERDKTKNTLMCGINVIIPKKYLIGKICQAGVLMKTGRKKYVKWTCMESIHR